MDIKHALFKFSVIKDNGCDENLVNFTKAYSGDTRETVNDLLEEFHNTYRANINFYSLNRKEYGKKIEIKKNKK